MLPNSRQTGNKSALRVVHTVSMERHLTTLHQWLQQGDEGLGKLLSQHTTQCIYIDSVFSQQYCNC